MRVLIRLLLVLLLVVVSSCGAPSPAFTPTPPSHSSTATPPPSPTPPPTATRPLATAPRPTAATSLPTLAAPTRPPEPTATARPTPVATAAPAATSTPEIVLTAIGELPNLSGQEVTVQGTLVWAASFSKGFRFILDDGTGQATLLMWLNVYDDCWDAPELIVAAVVRARGTVGQYEGEWQVEAGYGGDVKVLSPGTPPPLRQIGTIATGDLGTRLTVEGTVTQTESFSLGQRLYLDDGTGTILVLLWQNVFDRVADNGRLLTPGTRVRVSGVLEEYEGTLELVPQVPHGVIVQ